MNTIVKANGFEIEISEGLNDVFVKVTNADGNVIGDLTIDNNSVKLEEAVAKKEPVDHEEWSVAYEQIQDRIKHLNNVIYSAYKSVDGLPVNNLDEIAIHGNNLEIRYGDYKTTVFEPTWLKICEVADEAISSSGDFHHVYLEGLFFSKDDDCYKLSMGS